MDLETNTLNDKPYISTTWDNNVHIVTTLREYLISAILVTFPFCLVLYIFFLVNRIIVSIMKFL